MTSSAPPSSDGYRAIGEWYDAEHDRVTDDVALFVQLAEIVGDPILELGCGSGRILAALAEAGHRVTGVDRSEAMLRRAESRLAEHCSSGRAKVVPGRIDALAPTLAGRHGMVILSHNTLLHATSAEEQRAVLRAARDALDPRGMLVVDCINPLLDVRPGGDPSVVREGSWPAEDGVVTKLSSRRVDEGRQVISTDIWYDHVDRDGIVRRTETHLDLRYVTVPELLLMMELSGLVDPLVYGTYDLDPYEAGSPRIIVTAEAS